MFTKYVIQQINSIGSPTYLCRWYAGSSTIHSNIEVTGILRRALFNDNLFASFNSFWIAFIFNGVRYTWVQYSVLQFILITFAPSSYDLSASFLFVACVEYPNNFVYHSTLLSHLWYRYYRVYITSRAAT